MGLFDKVLTGTSKACTAGKKIVDDKKEETWSKKPPVSDEDVEEILKKLKEFSKLKEEFLSKMPEWKTLRQQTIDELYKIADECDSLHEDCNIANVTGSSVGAAGGIMALGGILLAPFTFGGSLTLTVAGAATGVAGAATNITTSVVESSKMKDKCKAAQDCLDNDRRKTEDINRIIESLMAFLKTIEALQEKLEAINNLESISIALDGTQIATKTAMSAVSIAKSAQALQIIRSFSAAEIAVLRECPKMMKGLEVFKGTALTAGKLATCLAAVGLGISIFEIVTTSQDIHAGSETEAGKRFRENAKSLKEQKDTLCEIEKKLTSQ